MGSACSTFYVPRAEISSPQGLLICLDRGGLNERGPFVEFFHRVEQKSVPRRAYWDRVVLTLEL